VTPSPVDYNGLLAPWGVSIGSDLVVDRKLNGVIRLPVQIRTRRGMRQIEQQVSSPLVPLLRVLNRQHPITRRLETLVAPFASALDLTDALAAPELEAEVLAFTSAGATVGARVTSLDPRTLTRVQDTEVAGPWPVLASIKGPLPTGYPDTSGAPHAPDGTRLLVGSSFELPFANPGLLLASVDWMAADEILLGIRPRSSTPSMLEVPDNVTWIRLANVAGLPLAVSILGVVHLRRRKRRGAA
jgi:ABC-type uncharacterized transport system involved in gliding motility auxiliary subunit